MAWQSPKTDWVAADGVTYGDMNRIEGNIAILRYADGIQITDALGEFDATEVEGALHELRADTVTGKNAVKAAVIGEGGTVSGDPPTYTQLATGVGTILQGNAAQGDVLQGKAFCNADSNNLTGTMPNRGVGGTIVPGVNTVTKQAGYYSSDIVVAGDADCIAANIRKGANLFGIAGTSIQEQYGRYIFGGPSSITMQLGWAYPGSNATFAQTYENGHGYTAIVTCYEVQGYPSHAYMVSQNPLDLTDYNYLIVWFGIGTWAYGQLGIGTTQMDDSITGLNSRDQYAGIHAHVLNVASYTGSYYLKFDLWPYNGSAMLVQGIALM